MGKVTQPSEKVSVDINVNVTYDPATGLPTAATGQKELNEANGGVGEEPVETLVILPATLATFEQAVAAANTACQNAIQAAKDELEAQIVKDNYPNGEFTAPTAESTSTESTSAGTGTTTEASSTTSEQPANGGDTQAPAQS